MLCRCSFSGYSSNVVANSFAYRDGWLFNYRLMFWLSPGIFQAARLKIIDPPLTLHSHSVDAALMICWGSVEASLTLRWRSVDSHFQNLVSMLSQPLLPREAASSLILSWCHRTALRLSKMAGQKLWTLYWHSVIGHRSDVIGIIFA
jgi:hypothetical protein